MIATITFKGGYSIVLDTVQSVEQVTAGIYITTCYGNGPTKHRDVIDFRVRCESVLPCSACGAQFVPLSTLNDEGSIGAPDRFCDKCIDAARRLDAAEAR